jgi:predicted ATP-dependent endonuclease of OLD family
LKIKFYNLGTIKETELDLRPLTIIIGPNNSNKTYIAYSTYGLLQASRNRSIHSGVEFQVKDNAATLKIDNKFKEFIDADCRQICDAFTANLTTFFQDSSRKLFNATRFELFASAEEVDQTLQRLNSKPLSDFNKSEYDASYDEGTITIRLNQLNATKGLRSGEVDFAFYYEFIRHLFSQQFLLPAERNAFIITYKVLLNKRFSLLRDRERRMFGKQDESDLQSRFLREQGDIRYPQPIEDFLDMLSDIELTHKQVKIPRSAENNGQRNGAPHDSFADVARQIERYIQGGNTTSYSPTTLGGSEIMVKVKKGLDIDLYNASSSIKQLAPLLLYLRYRAAENQLLIIDEPEMNLHPESQVKLLEILAILVNAGVKVMLTTHSPYLMAHLNNLVLNEQHSESVKEKQATSLYLKDPRAFLTMEQVSAYEMRDNQLRSLKDEEFGIRYDTLSDVSVDVQQKYFEIYEKGKPTKRAKTQKAASDIS